MRIPFVLFLFSLGTFLSACQAEATVPSKPNKPINTSAPVHQTPEVYSLPSKQITFQSPEEVAAWKSILQKSSYQRQAPTHTRQADARLFVRGEKETQYYDIRIERDGKSGSISAGEKVVDWYQLNEETVKEFMALVRQTTSK